MFFGVLRCLPHRNDTPIRRAYTQTGYAEHPLHVTGLYISGLAAPKGLRVSSQFGRGQCVVILSKSSLTCTRVRASSYLTLPSLTRRARS